MLFGCGQPRGPGGGKRRGIPPHSHIDTINILPFIQKK